jgi:hypothetical protein
MEAPFGRNTEVFAAYTASSVDISDLIFYSFRTVFPLQRVITGNMIMLNYQMNAAAAMDRVH